MPSPFPGMDPYLEISGDWRDFHATFIAHCRDTLNELLPDPPLGELGAKRATQVTLHRRRVGTNRGHRNFSAHARRS